VNFYENANFLWRFVSMPDDEGDREVEKRKKYECESDIFLVDFRIFSWSLDEIFFAEDGVEIFGIIGLRDMEEGSRSHLGDAGEGGDIDGAIDRIPAAIIEGFTFSIDEVSKGNPRGAPEGEGRDGYIV